MSGEWAVPAAKYYTLRQSPRIRTATATTAQRADLPRRRGEDPLSGPLRHYRATESASTLVSVEADLVCAVLRRQSSEWHSQAQARDERAENRQPDVGREWQCLDTRHLDFDACFLKLTSPSVRAALVKSISPGSSVASVNLTLLLTDGLGTIGESLPVRQIGVHPLVAAGRGRSPPGIPGRWPRRCRTA